MTKNKLNIIKLNIAIVLALICISCDVNKIDPKIKSHTNTKQTTQNFKNKSQGLKKNSNQESQDSGSSNQESQNLGNPSNQKSQDLKNYSNQSRDLGNPSNQESQKYRFLNKESQRFRFLHQESQKYEFLYQESQENGVSKLEKIGKILETEKKQEYAQIDNIATTQFDFLETFKLDSDDNISGDKRIQLKRIIYSSLNYDTNKIETLKEILEKLLKNYKHKNIAKEFIYDTSLGIQLNLDSRLEKITNKLLTLSQEESKQLLVNMKYDLKLKQRFAKTLNETIDAYNQNSQNIKTDDEKLANHMNENFKDFNSSLNPLYSTY
ncbi:lipoprotein [Borreliella japonica]|uniref:Lipoprotein n=1 Tax=Borreliella japonica TaxID=34095 RepID=A0A1G4Q345_BORJA|nr:complement regulator-acquiring protein [Borreliella japonica]SCW39020.1 lipoprotein [Borreliella japonica]